MTEGSATQPSPAARDRPGWWRSTLGDPAILAILTYALLAILALIAAYLTVFVNWAGYDDEGTLLVTLQAFSGGDTLYTDIYTPYGPFYFEFFGGLLALTGEAVTTDLSRTTVAVLWVATSLLFGIATQCLTRNLALGASGMVVAFASLFVLANEPMHPQVLCVLLLGAFVLLAACGPTQRPLWAGAAGGALLAALFLTKVNLGVYAVAAVVLAAALTYEPLRRRRWLSWPAIAAVLALPLFVSNRDLGLEWVRNMVAVETLAMAAIVVAALPLGAGQREDDTSVTRWLSGALAGFLVASAAILVAILLTGPTPADVYDGVVVEAMRVRDVLLSEFGMSAAVVDWALASVAGAVLSVWLRRSGEGGEPTIWPGLVRVVAGLAVWLTIARISPLALNPGVGNPVALGAVLAWIAVIPPAGVDESLYKSFIRVLLPALGVTEMLQAYPVAGSQVGIASLTMVPVGALLLADALTSLRAWAAARGGRDLQRLGVVVTVATIVIAADFAINSILRTIAVNGPIYSERSETPALKGASQLRLAEADAVNYTSLLGFLDHYRCTDFVGYPNVNSLYLWSGINPPPPAAPGAWIEALDTERQQRVVSEMRASRRPCAIRNDDLAASWIGAGPPPGRPLERYLLNEFRTVEEVGPFQFMLPTESGGGLASG